MHGSHFRGIESHLGGWPNYVSSFPRVGVDIVGPSLGDLGRIGPARIMQSCAFICCRSPDFYVGAYPV